jgi:hypothetical protein
VFRYPAPNTPTGPARKRRARTRLQRHRRAGTRAQRDPATETESLPGPRARAAALILVVPVRVPPLVLLVVASTSGVAASHWRDSDCSTDHVVCRSAAGRRGAVTVPRLLVPCVCRDVGAMAMRATRAATTTTASVSCCGRVVSCHGCHRDCCVVSCPVLCCAVLCCQAMLRCQRAVLPTGSGLCCHCLGIPVSLANSCQ